MAKASFRGVKAGLKKAKGRLRAAATRKVGKKVYKTMGKKAGRAYSKTARGR